MQNINTKRIRYRSGKATALSVAPLTIWIVFSAIVLLGLGSLYAARPTKAQKLNATLCTSLGGTWTTETCTIAGGASGAATSSFFIPNSVSLVIQGDGAHLYYPDPVNDPTWTVGCTLGVEPGVTIENQGTIRVETSAAAGEILIYGMCNFGTISNPGTITVANSGVGGITNLGAITNTGTIEVENADGSEFGIGNFSGSPGMFEGTVATMTNSGAIHINNSGWLGIINFAAGGSFSDPETGAGGTAYSVAALTNLGTISVTNIGGDGSSGIENDSRLTNSGTIIVSGLTTGDHGITNYGTFINEVSGTLSNEHGQMGTWKKGIYNNQGTMINYGTTNNTGFIETQGWAMLTYGTIHNDGTLYQTGGVLVNYGTVYNSGTITTDGTPDYPHNRGICINEVGEDGVTIGSGC